MSTRVSPSWDGQPAPEGGPDVCDGAGDDALEGGGTAASRGWGPGWPRCQTQKLTTVDAAPGVRLSVHRDIAPLVTWLCEETVRRGYRLRPGQCWGFACRAIRGSSAPSNHSWGLAVDLNSLANPMGSSLVTDMPRWMPRLWTEHGFRWGGDYLGRKDAMHYEYVGTPRDAEGLVAGLGGPRQDDGFPLPRGHWFGWAEGPAERDPRCHDGRRGDDQRAIRRLQRMLIEQQWDLGPTGPDGIFGPRVHRAVLAFQRQNGLEADGLVGPRTWRAIRRRADTG